MTNNVRTFAAVYLAVGFLIVIGLFGWLAVSSGATIKGEWDPVGVIFVALLWLLYFALLRWHWRANARARDAHRHARRLA
jgi:hypothetical protein